MQDYDYMDYMDYTDYMRAMNMPNQYSPMMEMPQEQLESMYPRCYFIIIPEVVRHCDMHCAKYGHMHMPSRQQVESMVNEIDNRVGSDVDDEYRDMEEDDRPFGFGFSGRRRFGRDLITILLLREFIGRRPHHHRFQPEFGGGFGQMGGYEGFPY